MKFGYNYVNHLANKFGFTIMLYIYLPCQNVISGQVSNKEIFTINQNCLLYGLRRSLNL